MGAILGGGQQRAPVVLPPVAPPSRSDAEVQAAAERERRRRRAAIGRASTNLTGDEGVTDELTVRRPTLLGGVAQATGA